MDLTRAFALWIFVALTLIDSLGCGGGPGDPGEQEDSDDAPALLEAIDADDNNPFDDIDSDNPPPDQVDVSGSTSEFGDGVLIAESPTLQDSRPSALVDEPPVIRLVDDNGGPIAGVRVSFEAVAGGSVDDEEAITDEDGRVVQTGWRSGSSVGFYAMDATVAGATLRFAVRANSSYAIQLDFRSMTSASIRAAFRRAAARWSGVIMNDLADASLDTRELPDDCGQTAESNSIDVDDLLIIITLPEIDGVGRVIGQAGPCVVRTADESPVVGSMDFDIDDLAELESVGRLEAVVLHEMAHVLGVGTLWEGLLENPSLDNPGADTRFTGTLATQAFQELGADEGSVPVENRGGVGSADGHWRESVFDNELMTPRVEALDTDLPLSTVTVRSIADLGMYTVNGDAADFFELPIEPRGLRKAGEVVFELKDDLIRPSYRLGLEGELTRIPDTSLR